jgi:hypothetical protein
LRSIPAKNLLAADKKTRCGDDDAMVGILAGMAIP